MKTHGPVKKLTFSNRFLDQDGDLGMPMILADKVVKRPHDALFPFKDLNKSTVLMKEESGNPIPLILALGLGQKIHKLMPGHGVGGLTDVCKMKHGAPNDLMDEPFK